MFRKIKETCTMILTIVLSILLGITIVSAETAPSSLTIKSTSVKSTPMSFPQTFHVKKAGSKYVYCSTYSKKTPSSGIKYSKSSKITDNGENYILREAYKNVKNNNDFFIYQTALWIYRQDKGTMTYSNSINTFRKKVYSSNSSTAKKIKSIVASAKKAGKNDTSAPTIKISGSDVKFTLDSNGKNYVSSKIKVTSSVSKYTVSFSGAPSGTTYKISGGYLYVYVPASKVTKLTTSFKVNVSNSKTVYTSYNYKPSSSSYQKMAATYKETKTAKASLSLKLTKNVKLNVTKVDAETGKAVSGAKMQVTNSSGKVIASFTTNGKAYTLSNLAKGTYTLTEVQAPNGYNLNKASVKFIVDDNGNIKNSDGSNITNLVYKNYKALKVLKVDADNEKAVSGAKLEIKNAKGEVVDSWTSDGNAHTVKSLTAGTYTLSEKEAPEGYVLSDEKVTFTVNTDGSMKDSNNKNITQLVMKNTKNSIKISKQDITDNKELPGATLRLVDSKGKEIDTWVSGEEDHVIKGLAAGEYKLTEIVAPEGYVISKETISFKVDNKGNLFDSNGKSIDKVIMYNTPAKEIGVEISKQDITNNKELPGASLTLTGKDNVVIDTWVSGEEPHTIKNIEPGTYTLTEKQAPEGYVLSEEKITFTVDKDGKITDKDGKSIDKVIMYNKPIEEKHVTISKRDITNNKELPGASLTLKDSNGTVIDSWVSATKPHEIKDIKAGTYTLTETTAPEGYVLSSETITFTIDNSGVVTDKAGNKLDEVIMYNKPTNITTVEISKQDITTNKELPGATLQVKNSKGEVVDSWVSGTTSHKITNLTEGTYTLTETIAPEGYVLSTKTITFKIDSNGKLTNECGTGIDKIVMYNEKQQVTPNKIPFVKVDAKTNKNLAGATLEVKDSEGNIKDTWVTTTEAHYIELSEGTYTLTEKQAPNGYILNKTPITFNITSDGKITDKDGKTINTIIMSNTPEEVTTKVNISKQDITNGKELPGAHLVVKDSNGNVVDDWISTNTPHTITGLTPGEYTLHEVVAPNGYVLSDETVKFTVKADGSVTNVVMYNAPKTTPTTPNNPSTPNSPSTPGKEIEVENTSSFKSIVSSLIGGVAIALGTFKIKRNKREEF